MSFGERLRELREEKGMTQEDLGRLLGVTGRQAGNYEANKQFIRDEDSFIKLINYFNVSADYLFGLCDERNYDKMFDDLSDYKNMSEQSKQELRSYIKYLINKDIQASR